jgi:hypothetical protein
MTQIGKLSFIFSDLLQSVNVGLFQTTKASFDVIKSSYKIISAPKEEKL